jgi:hypothetical protein
VSAGEQRSTASATALATTRCTVEAAIATRDPHVVDPRVGSSKKVVPDRFVKIASSGKGVVRRVFQYGLVDVDAHAATVRGL